MSVDTEPRLYREYGLVTHPLDDAPDERDDRVAAIVDSENTRRTEFAGNIEAAAAQAVLSARALMSRHGEVTYRDADTNARSYSWVSADGYRIYTLQQLGDRQYGTEEVSHWREPVVFSVSKATDVGNNYKTDFLTRVNLSVGQPAVMVQPRYAKNTFALGGSDEKILSVINAELSAELTRANEAYDKLRADGDDSAATLNVEADIDEALAELARLSTAANRIVADGDTLLASLSPAESLAEPEFKAAPEILAARAEAAAMAERQAGSPEFASFQMSDTLMRRIQLFTDTFGVEKPISYNDDPDSYVETWIGVDAQGRHYYTVHDHMGKETSISRLPDSLVVQEGDSKIVYDISKDGVIMPLNDRKGVVEQRIELFDRLGGLNAYLAERAKDIAKEDLPLQVRIPMMIEGEGITSFPHIMDVDVNGMPYRIAIFNNEHSNNHAVYVIDRREGVDDTHILRLPKDIRQAPFELHPKREPKPELAQIISSALDRIQGVVVEPQNEYDAALQIVTDLMDSDQDTAFRQWREPHLERRVITINNNGRLFKVEQINDGQVERPVPYTRVTVTDVDTSGKQTGRGEYELTPAGFVPLGKSNFVASRRAERLFDDFATSLLNVSRH